MKNLLRLTFGLILAALFGSPSPAGATGAETEPHPAIQLKPVWSSGTLATARSDLARNQVIEDGVRYAVTNAGRKLAVIDGADWTNQSLLALTDTYYGSVDLRKRDDYLYLSGARLTVADVSDPSRPREIWADDVSSWSHGMFLLDDRLYVTHHVGHRFRILDVSDPSRPVELSQKRGASFRGAHDVFVEDGYAYVANYLARAGTPALAVVDVSDPANPSIAGLAAKDDVKFSHILKRGDHLFIGSHYPTYGLFIYDVSEPADPVRVGQFFQDRWSAGYWMDWWRDYLVAAAADSVLFIDVADPESPFIAGEKALSDSGPERMGVKNLAIEGDYLHVSVQNYGEGRRQWVLDTYRIEALEPAEDPPSRRWWWPWSR